MKNLEIAKIFYEMAEILELQGVQWKPQAYRKAARSIETLSEDLEITYNKKGITALKEIPGVGENLAKKIEQFIKTGKINEYERLKKTLPKGLEELMHVQSLGPKKALKLHKELKIQSIKDLETAAKKGKIRTVEGFGEKSEQDILRGIRIFEQSIDRIKLGEILPIARELAEKIKKQKETKKNEIGGSIRRMKETARDIDILAISTNPEKTMQYFTTQPDVATILAKGPTKSMVLLKNGIQADIRVIEPRAYGAALQYFTGNKDHNIKLRQIAIKKGYKLSEYGLFKSDTNKFICGKTEQEIYKKLGLQYIEPELRENTGEIDAAMQKKLPKIVTYDAIKGDLHIHTNWSDGTSTADEMIQTAIKMKYSYVAITDHSKSEHIANGMDEKRLEQYISEIEKLKRKYANEIKIFTGSEVTILRDGSLDYSDKYLKKLDWVTASVHLGFKQTKQEMTKRITTALQNPYVCALSHPTGRLINERDPYELDLEKVFETAKERNVALEINSHPKRLDLKDTHIKTAKEIGAKFAINTDSHNQNHLRFIEFGIAQARRGWAEAKDIINTLPLNKFEKLLR